MSTTTEQLQRQSEPLGLPSISATRRTVTSQLAVAARISLVAIVLCGLLYPLAVFAVSQGLFGGAADGSLVSRDGIVIGSSLIGQGFTKPEYLHPRPSAAGEGYDGLASAGSNLGPSNPDLEAVVLERAAAYREENGLAADAPVPADAVTASGSGLDPEISPANAELQAARIAQARDIPVAAVRAVIEDHTTGRTFGVLGEPGVNVLEVNLALDGLPDR